MAVLVVNTFEVVKLTPPALRMLKAAVLYAEENRQIQMHRMTIDAFCHLAGLPPLPVKRFWSLLGEACCALAIVEAVDTSAPDRDDLPYSSWPVFETVCIDGCDVMFRVCNETFDDACLVGLRDLRPSTRKRIEM